MTVDPAVLRETVALQRFHARHGLGGLPPANLDVLRRNRSYSPTTESQEWLVGEAVAIYRELERHWSTDPRGLRMLARERGVHNVPRLIAAEAR